LLPDRRYRPLDPLSRPGVVRVVTERRQGTDRVVGLVDPGPGLEGGGEPAPFQRPLPDERPQIGVRERAGAERRGRRGERHPYRRPPSVGVRHPDDVVTTVVETGASEVFADSVVEAAGVASEQCQRPVVRPEFEQRHRSVTHRTGNDVAAVLDRGRAAVVAVEFPEVDPESRQRGDDAVRGRRRRGVLENGLVLPPRQQPLASPRRIAVVERVETVERHHGVVRREDARSVTETLASVVDGETVRPVVGAKLPYVADDVGRVPRCRVQEREPRDAVVIVSQVSDAVVRERPDRLVAEVPCERLPEPDPGRVRVVRVDVKRRRDAKEVVGRVHGRPLRPELGVTARR